MGQTGAEFLCVVIHSRYLDSQHKNYLHMYIQDIRHINDINLITILRITVLQSRVSVTSVKQLQSHNVQMNT